MSITATSRLASALLAVAAAGSLAIGLSGPASADPGNKPVGPPAHFVVTNKTKAAVKFVEYGSSFDKAHSGPNPGFTVQPGQSFGFDITVWEQGGHQTVAKLAATQGKESWYVYMKASSKGGDVAFCSSDYTCSPINPTATNNVSLS